MMVYEWRLSCQTTNRTPIQHLTQKHRIYSVKFGVKALKVSGTGSNNHGAKM